MQLCASPQSPIAFVVWWLLVKHNNALNDSKHTTRIPLVPTLAQSFSMKGGGTKTKTKVGSNLTCGGDGAGGWYDQTPARLN